MAWPVAFHAIASAEHRLATHRDENTTLAAGRDGVRLVTMFYTSCAYACPAMIESLRGIERALSTQERGHLGVLMVSFDPARDTVGELAALAMRRGVDSDRWTLAHASVSDTARLAERLGVRYRPLADGSFEHSSRIALLDGEGRIVATTGRLGTPEPEFVAAVRRVLANPPASPGSA